MAVIKKNIGEAPYVTTMARQNSVMVEIDSKIYRVKLSDLSTIIDSEGVVLEQIAWGIPIKAASQSATNWGVVGNTAIRTAYESRCGRYLVTNTGKAAKLTKTNMGDAGAGTVNCADGTVKSQTLGHIMFIAPRLYFLYKTIDGQPYLWLSESPISNHYLETADGYMCVGAFPATIVSDSLTSRMGAVPANNQTINTFWSKAQNNGGDFGLTDYENFFKFCWMYGVGHYGDTNIQSKLGNGLCGTGDNFANVSALVNGATNALGDTWGNVPIGTGTNACHVNLGGLENLYGLRYEMLQGIYFGSSANTPTQNGSEAFVYRANRLPSTAELASSPLGSFRQLVRLTSTGYVKTILGGEYFDLLAATVGGASTSYFADQQYASATGQLCLGFGAAPGGLDCGLACAHSVAAWSYANSAIGSRLAYYGKLDFVDGRQIV